jgi:hypothetical protein
LNTNFHGDNLLFLSQELAFDGAIREEDEAEGKRKVLAT